MTADQPTDQTAESMHAVTTMPPLGSGTMPVRQITITPPAEPTMLEFERIARDIEWRRAELYRVSLDLYRAIDQTPDDAEVDRNVAEAYQQVNRAIHACDDARRALITAAVNNGFDPRKF